MSQFDRGVSRGRSVARTRSRCQGRGFVDSVVEGSITCFAFVGVRNKEQKTVYEQSSHDVRFREVKVLEQDHGVFPSDNAKYTRDRRVVQQQFYNYRARFVFEPSDREDVREVSRNLRSLVGE